MTRSARSDSRPAASSSGSTRRRAAGLAAALAVTLGAGLASAPGAAAATPAGVAAVSAPASGPTSEVDPRAAAAMAAQFGISVAQAQVRLSTQGELGDRGARLAGALGDRSGGSYLDAQGRLVVTTLDAAADSSVRAQGATAARVRFSARRLADVAGGFDALARRSGAGAVQGWYVDVPGNRVVLTLTAGASDATTRGFAQLAARAGAAVQVEYAPAAQTPRPSSEYLADGLQYVIANGGTCSIGFNTRDSAGRNVILTAGHCVKQAGNMSRNGYVIGATRTADYPGHDFGTFYNSYPNYWLPTVSVAKYNGTYVSVRGLWTTPPVGATVCKSGRTTGYTCGTILALNQTVVYTGGITVYGLVRHNACVEPGDSGGANISSGAYALGMTSGASTSNGLCLSKVGGANVSWYQPAGPALTANGLSLLYQP